MSQSTGEIVVTEKLTNFEIGDEAGLAMARALFGLDKPYEPAADVPSEDPMLHEQVTTGEYDTVLTDALGGEPDTTDWSEYLHQPQHVSGLDDLGIDDAPLFSVGEVIKNRRGSLRPFVATPQALSSHAENSEGWFRRNRRKVAVAVAGGLAVAASVFGLQNAGNSATDEAAKSLVREAAEAVAESSTTTLAPTTTESTTTIAVERDTSENLPSQQDAVAQTPDLPPAVVEAEGASQVFRIDVGDTVWDILQTELTGQDAGAVDFDPEVTRTIFTLMDQIAVTNGFGDDTDRLSGLDPGFNLQLSEESVGTIAAFRASRGLA